MCRCATRIERFSDASPEVSEVVVARESEGPNDEAESRTDDLEANR